MQYAEREQLTILQLKSGVDSVSMERLKQVLTERPSNMVYCEEEGKLIGIISTGDILKAKRKGQNEVLLNKEFTFLRPGEQMKARRIFLEKEHIHAIPVVAEGYDLSGEYTRWDDFLQLQYGLGTGRGCAGDWGVGQTIALVKPCGASKKRQQIFDVFREYLEQFNLTVCCIGHSEVVCCMDLADMVLLVDEKEYRACDTVLKMMLGEYHKGRHKLKTYKDVLCNAAYCGERYAAYLESLHEQGVHILGLTFDEEIYYKCLEMKFYDKYAALGVKASNMVPQFMYRDFFGELYSEEYAEQILNIPFAVANDKGIFKLKDCTSHYYNVAGGERRTIGQPESHERTIYFFGPCYIYGHYAEDKNTMESFLQGRLSDQHPMVRVVNCGCMGMYDGYLCLPYIANTPLREGDIVVVGMPPEGVRGIEYLDLNRFVAECDVDVKWMVNHPMHCGHKVYQLYADAVYKKLEPVLKEAIKGQGEVVKQDKDYIKLLYLDRYFTEFDPSRYEKTGAVVMNCNPFTYGHRYLIDQALDKVDFLIIFVVEEDRSLFSFQERFAMVCRGTAGLKNVKVVPSGPFILSQMSFPEYFVKTASSDIQEHTEQDVIVFAECIAPQLGIQYRFVGEEPEDGVTNQYNLAMKRILPQYGMELVEIPRRKVRGKYISASAVRRCMEEEDADRLKELLPETTRELLGYGRNGT